MMVERKGRVAGAAEPLCDVLVAARMLAGAMSDHDRRAGGGGRRPGLSKDPLGALRGDV